MKSKTRLLLLVSLLLLGRICWAQNSGSESDSDSESEKVVCLYTGQGISPLAAARLEKKLRKTGALTQRPESFYEIKDPSQLESFLSSKDKNSVCLVVPGGNTYQLTLGMGNKRDHIFRQIRSSVASGGSYLGICCGANLACSRLMYGTDSKAEELLGPELSLGLLKVDACFFSHTVDRSLPDFKMGKWVSVQTESDSFPVYWNQGSHYSKVSSDVCVLATYRDSIVRDAPSILYGNFGKGRVVACAVHPEFSYKAVQRDFHLACSSSDDPNADLKKQKEAMDMILEKVDLH